MDSPLLRRGLLAAGLLLCALAARADTTISGPITFGSGFTVTASTPPKVTPKAFPAAVGWPAALDPNNIVLANIAVTSTITAIVGTPEIAVGAAATVSVYKAPSGTACGAGTILHSGSFDANGTAATNQSLTLVSTSLAAGDRICLKTTGGNNWTGGVGVGTITVFLGPS